MVELYKEFGDLEDALNLLKDAEERSGEVSAGLRLQMVYIYWELEEYQKASSLLDDLAKRFPESDRITYMSGLGQEKIGRFTAAIQTYIGIEPTSSFYAHGAYRSVLLYLQLNDVENAISLAKKMIRIDQKNNKDFYMLLAQIYADTKAYDDAIEVLGEAYEKYPGEITFLFTKAVHLEKKGDYQSCVATLKEVIKKDEKFSSALNFLGYLYAERGENLEEAASLIKKALEIKPDDGFYLDSLGWVYFQKEDYPLALKTLLKANEFAPNEGVILEHISDVYKALGNEAKALEFIEAASKARMDDRDKKRIENKYKEMNEK
jgi:tetratricopeptide (TPR) repeat protein